MPAAHVNGQFRSCGATTVVEGQENVWVNDELWAVEEDPNSHGGGGLISETEPLEVFINDMKVINNTPDGAYPDSAGHVYPSTAEGSENVFAGLGEGGSGSSYDGSSGGSSGGLSGGFGGLIGGGGGGGGGDNPQLLRRGQIRASD